MFLQDVIHELKINKLKKRNFYPSASIPGLDPKVGDFIRYLYFNSIF